MENNTDISGLLKKKICDFDFSMRLLNGLRAADIETVADIISYHKSDLLRFRNFGRKTLQELEEFLESKKLYFGMNISDAKIENESFIYTRAQFKKFIWEKGEDWAIGYFNRERIFDLRRASEKSEWKMNGGNISEVHSHDITEIHQAKELSIKPLDEIIKELEKNFQSRILQRYFDFSA